MPLSRKPVLQLAEADLLALIADKEAENKMIEYKRDRVGQADNDKKEFLYDVSSFANTAGGHIVFGMEEKEGLPVALPGLEGINPDNEIARLEQIARDGVRPPIIGLQFAQVRLANGNVALVLRIPKSWNPPHQVTYQKAFRFYARDTNSKYQLDVDELRSIFSLSEGVAEKVRLFRINRVAKIVGGEAPVPLEPSAKMVTHILPLAAFSTKSAVDLKPLWHDPTPLIGVMGQGGSHRFNVDGLFLAARDDRPSSCYVEVFRNGCIEIVDSYSEEANNRAQLPSIAFERDVFRQIHAGQKLLQIIGAQPPVVILLTMLGMKGWTMAAAPGLIRSSYGAFDRDPLFVPEMILETFDGDVARNAKPLLDATWNAAGWPGSENYDRDGVWRAGR